MLVEINEPIETGVVFQKNQVRPVWFSWQGRKYSIEKIAYRWKERRGETWLHFFSAFDGTQTFELVYDSKSLQWTLGRVSGD